jgi:hypothetical protein
MIGTFGDWKKIIYNEVLLLRQLVRGSIKSMCNP